MIALIIAVLALWLVAAFLWFADGSSTRATIDHVLSHDEEPLRVTHYEDRAA